MVKESIINVKSKLSLESRSFIIFLKSNLEPCNRFCGGIEFEFGIGYILLQSEFEHEDNMVPNLPTLPHLDLLNLVVTKRA